MIPKCFKPQFENVGSKSYKPRFCLGFSCFNPEEIRDVFAGSGAFGNYAWSPRAVVTSVDGQSGGGYLVVAASLNN